jgi:Uma2 family endonuclease
MAFVLEQKYLPAFLAAPPLSDEQFVDFCARHAEYRFESTDEGDLFVTAPSSSSVSRSISEIEFQLQTWARHDGRGTATKAPIGFLLPNGARRRPSVAWTNQSRMTALSPSGQTTFLPCCPDVVIEFKLPAGLPKISHAKMQEYMENGAQLGWLIDPETRSVTIYRTNEQPETLTTIDSLTATEPLTNFILDLAEVWNPLQ